MVINMDVFYVWFDAPIDISITSNYSDQWEKWWLKNNDECQITC